MDYSIQASIEGPIQRSLADQPTVGRSLEVLVRMSEEKRSEVKTLFSCNDIASITVPLLDDTSLPVPGATTIIMHAPHVLNLDQLFNLLGEWAESSGYPKIIAALLAIRDEAVPLDAFPRTGLIIYAFPSIEKREALKEKFQRLRTDAMIEFFGISVFP